MVFNYQPPTAEDLKKPPAAFYNNPILASRRTANWGIALLLVGFAATSYIYTMAAVKRNEFSDFDDQGNPSKPAASSSN